MKIDKNVILLERGSETVHTKEELYKRFQVLGKKCQQLGYIVQNEGQTTTHEELDEFENNLNTLLAEIKKMNHFVVSHYQREDGIR